MKIKNFNSGWGQMMVAHARGRQLVRLGVVDVKKSVAVHNDAQADVMRAYVARGYRILAGLS